MGLVVFNNNNKYSQKLTKESYKITRSKHQRSVRGCSLPKLNVAKELLTRENRLFLELLGYNVIKPSV